MYICKDMVAFCSYLRFWTQGGRPEWWTDSRSASLFVVDSSWNRPAHNNRSKNINKHGLGLIPTANKVIAVSFMGVGNVVWFVHPTGTVRFESTISQHAVILRGVRVHCAQMWRWQKWGARTCSNTIRNLVFKDYRYTVRAKFLKEGNRIWSS